MFVINKDLCTNCQECLENCPNGAIEENEQKEVQINVSLCSDSAICKSVCPFEDIKEKADN